MRDMSYNILNGGRDGSRWRDQLRVVADARPDVLVVLPVLATIDLD